MADTSVKIDEGRWHSQHDRDAGREPCPDRIVEDLGSAFGMGCLGGWIWNFGKGIRNSPKGERFAGALFSAKSRAPILGGNFAVWGGTFSTFDCTLQYIRRTDDWVNNVSAGFLTGGVLAARGGWRQAGRNACMGGVILAIIECVSALLMRQTAKSPKEMQEEQLAMEKQQKDWEEAQKLRGSGGGGMFGGLGSGFFGGTQPQTSGFGTSSSSSSQSTSSGFGSMLSGFSSGSSSSSDSSGQSGSSSSEFVTPSSEFAPDISTSGAGPSFSSSSDSFSNNSFADAGMSEGAGGNGGGESGARKGGWW